MSRTCDHFWRSFCDDRVIEGLPHVLQEILVGVLEIGVVSIDKIYKVYKDFRAILFILSNLFNFAELWIPMQWCKFVCNRVLFMRPYLLPKSVDDINSTQSRISMMFQHNHISLSLSVSGYI